MLLIFTTVLFTYLLFLVVFTRTWTKNLIVEKALAEIIAGDFNIYTAKEKRLLILAIARTLFC